MVFCKRGAWTTGVVNNESVSSALVLAESIRRTRSNFVVTCITSLNVSRENRVKLHGLFDMVFLMDESCMPDANFKTLKDDGVAKAYTFKLMLFDKCVFVSANSMLLENADILFHETGHKFIARKTGADGSYNLACFSMEPNKTVFNQLWEGVEWDSQRINNEFLGLWFGNQGAALKIGNLPNGILADLTVSEGKLLGGNTHAPIIHFAEMRNARGLDVNEIKFMENFNLGKHEMLIRTKWLEMFEKSSTTTFPDMRFQLKTEERYPSEPIAIVGMSCRYPGANSVEEFWNLLYAGNEGIRQPPEFRWKKEHALRVTQQDRKSQAGFLNVPVDEFDTKFFGISPKEAVFMDPQVRLMHEVLWESLEDAGIDPQSLYGSHTGIFYGSWMNDYRDIVTYSPEKEFFRTYMGNSIGASAARISFLLGLTGPSVATESGCSSAIVALDLAVSSLRKGETNLALTGGVNLLLHPFETNLMEYVISPDGRCKTFDANANGFGRAEGCGVLVLKRMSDALRDRDNIWALIRGSAVSQEGLSRSLGTPTVQCEALAMQLALKNAGVTPDQVSFVETHGTGTSVGDPMEVAAIAKAYYTPQRKDPLVIGSVKTNVGHTESCSGITGIMKSVLALQNELIPKHLHLETLNPEIFLDSIPAVIPTEPMAWPKVPGQPRLCGVSSFGITGTDGHVILQEAPDYAYPKFTVGLERPTHIIKISGKSPEALEELMKEYENRFLELAETGTVADFANMAYSTNVGRATFNHRTFIVANDFQSAAKSLQETKCLLGDVKEGNDSKICFLFTGQGSQYSGMAKTLYETSPIFQINFDACDRRLKETFKINIRNVLWESDPQSKELSRTIYSQTSIFCIEYCLLKLWESWGIKPDFVLGHSLGEFCAAVAAEILSFEDALKLVAERSRLIDNLPGGSMLVIKASKPEVEKLLASTKTELDFAAINNPEQTVVAGDAATVHSFLNHVKYQNVKAIILEATHAFHSKHMDPMLEEYRQIATNIEYKPGNPDIQFVSGMQGQIIEDISEVNADYWVRHTRENVNFIDACTALKESGCVNFLEVGPQPVLSSFVMMNNEGVSMNCYPSLRKGTDDWETILSSLGKLYLHGYQVDWKGYDDPYIRKKVSLPFHPFHRKSFWVECSGDYNYMIHPLVGHPMKNASALSIFQNDLLLKSLPYLKDHCIGSRFVFPGAGFTEICLAAGYSVANGLTEEFEQPTRPIKLENVKIEAPLELTEGKSCRLQVLVDLPETDVQNQDESDNNSGFRVKIYHKNTNDNEEIGKWILHSTATFSPVASTKEFMKLWNPSRIPEIFAQTQPTVPTSFYTQADQLGLKFGETFRSVLEYWSLGQKTDQGEQIEVVTKIALPTDWNKYLLHPCIIDAMFQTSMIAKEKSTEARLCVPIGVGQLTLLSPLHQLPENEFLYLHSWQHPDTGTSCAFLCTQQLVPLAYIESVETIDTNVKTIESVLEQQSNPLPSAWEEVWKPVANQPFASAINFPIDVNGIVKDIVLQPTPDDVMALHLKSQRLLTQYIVRTLHELGWEPAIGQTIADIADFCKQLQIQPQFKQLIRFYFFILEQQVGVLKLDQSSQVWTVVKLPSSGSALTSEIQQLSDYLKTTKSRVIVHVYERVANSLAAILKGQCSALNLLFPQEPDLQEFDAQNYYLQHPARPEYERSHTAILKPVLKVKNTSSPSSGQVYRVLEVGAGTGSMTVEMLKYITEEFGDRIEYYFTDISQMFFSKAEKRFWEYKDLVKFMVFNIEESPLSQGIPLEFFDIVVANDVLHATKDIQETLTYLRQTLRPGGIFFFTDTVVPALGPTFVFGVLEGYWRFQDFEWRPHHCTVGTEVWRELLHRTGYNSVHCWSIYADEFGIVIAMANEDFSVEKRMVHRRNTEEMPREWFVFADKSEFEMAAYLANMLDSSSYKVEILLQEQDVLEEKQRVLLKKEITCSNIRVTDEHEIRRRVTRERVHGVIYGWGMKIGEIDQENVARPFLHIAASLMSLDKVPLVYVITQGIHPITEDALTVNPSAATLFGMLKCFKNENLTMFARYVDLERGLASEETAKQMLYELAMHKTSSELKRVQVGYRASTRYEPRLVKALVQTAKDDMKLPPSTERYHLKLPETKLIQDLEFEPLEEESVGEKEVEVKTKAFALNFRDIFAILKPSEEFEKLNGVGLDFAGVVTRVGEGSRYTIGDRVFGANFKDGQLPSHLVIDERAVLKIPESMTYWEAATLPAVFLTAYYCLVTVGKLKKEDTVLIHTGSGGVGLAAIQLAQHVGATIITTAGNPRKRAYLRSLGIEHVFHSRDTSYEQDILRVTSGRGVDFVLNSITGPGIKEATLRATAKDGRWIEMSKLSVWTPEEVKEHRPDVDYKIVDLTTLDQDKCTKLLEKMESLLEHQTMKPLPYVKFDALSLRQAMQYFQKAKHIGKVVISMPEVSMNNGQFKTQVSLFNSESTYLITGGLGGIGFEVCKWMLQLGARNIVLTGRSPPKPDVEQQIQSLNGRGYNVTVILADVGDYQHCRNLINRIKLTDKPLRGIMHCAGVLRDDFYLNQTWEKFEATFTPKVRGTWNLHELTVDCALEYFVMFSSLTALMGSPGQPNHAAANCFEDAFVHYRHSKGMPGTTINWGVWAQVGCAKDINVSGVFPVSLKRMLKGLETSLRTQKRQVCYSEFDSFPALAQICPLLKGWLDNRLWKQSEKGNQTNQLLKAELFWKDMDAAETKEEKMEVVSNYMKIILRQALRLEADDPIGDDTDLQELGVDSLMMIELKNSVQSLLGNRLSLTAAQFKNCNTVRLLANALVTKLMHGDGEDEQVPLDPLPEAELIALLKEAIILPEDIILSDGTKQAVKISQVQTVLVTGASGSFGPYIVAELSRAYPNIEKIICLSREEEILARERLKVVMQSMEGVTLSKIEFVRGNFVKPNFGIASTDQYNNLSEEVDAVIHLAAKNHPAEHFRKEASLTDIRSVNILGFCNVLRFACKTRVKHVYFPSAVLCGMVRDRNTLSDEWPDNDVVDEMATLKIPGAQCSKWICELLMKQASGRGIPCKVFRLPAFGGESGTGKLDVFSNLYFIRFLSFLTLGAMPEMPLPANLLPIDVCAELSLKLFLDETVPNEVYNIVHPDPRMEHEFVQLAEEEFGKKVEILEWSQFEERLKEHEKQTEGTKGLHVNQKLIGAYYGDISAFAKTYFENSEAFFANGKVNKWIENYDKRFDPSIEYLRRGLKYLKETGVMDKVGI